MRLENKITSYLFKYGNTREADLINYGVESLGCSSEEIKGVLARMVMRKRLHRIVHRRLEPPAVYLSLIGNVPPHIMNGFVEIGNSMILEKEANAILREAESLVKPIADKTLKKMFDIVKISDRKEEKQNMPGDL